MLGFGFDVAPLTMALYFFIVRFGCQQLVPSATLRQGQERVGSKGVAKCEIEDRGLSISPCCLAASLHVTPQKLKRALIRD